MSSYNDDGDNDSNNINKNINDIFYIANLKNTDVRGYQ